MCQVSSDSVLRVFSFGGGVQSTAVLVLAAQGKLHYDAFIFSNVGADSENPATLEYIEKYAKPYAKEHDINLIEIQKKKANGEIETVYSRIMNTPKSVPIPMRVSNGMPSNRACTSEFKIRIISKYIKQIYNVDRYIVGLGISTDEIHRAKTTEWEYRKKQRVWKKAEYPLIDLMLSRNQCAAIIYKAGLPMPPKSSCYFCPFHSTTEWIRLKSETPELFNKAVEIERFVNKKRNAIENYNKMWMHRSLMPLDKAVGTQFNLFDELDNCESGYCMV